jgi:flagella basal body P-ring formation protein FlgA
MRAAHYTWIAIAAAAGFGAPARAAEALSPQALPPQALPPQALPPIVKQAIERALTVPGARIAGATEEAGGASRPAGCRITEAETLRPVDGSGRIAVKLAGQRAGGAPCDAWIWVRVRVTATVAVSTRALRAGEPLAGATVSEERELHAGRPPAVIGPQDVASRSIGVGQVVQADQVGAATVSPGSSLKVLVVAGALSIEQSGRAVPCSRGRTCALLASGRHVEGDLVEGRLVVQSP